MRAWCKEGKSAIIEVLIGALVFSIYIFKDKIIMHYTMAKRILQHVSLMRTVLTGN